MCAVVAKVSKVLNNVVFFPSRKLFYAFSGKPVLQVCDAYDSHELTSMHVSTHAYNCSLFDSYAVHTHRVKKVGYLL